MRNLDYYKKDAFEFHQKVVGRRKNTKRDQTYKERVMALDDGIQQRFNTYDTHFEEKSLIELKSGDFDPPTRKDLINLYSYRSAYIQQLKTEITTIEKNRILNTCQNCTISEVSSMDHLIPKEDFPEFVVNPKNLFPSCTKCNSLKGVRWREDGSQQFLNLYVDVLPPEQYLFCAPQIGDGVIHVIFEVRNDNNIEPRLFALIESHYSKLRLCDRFRESAYSIISELENLFVSYKRHLSGEEIRDLVFEKAKRDKSVFGCNYWKSILETSLISTPEFIATMLI